MTARPTSTTVVPTIPPEVFASPQIAQPPAGTPVPALPAAPVYRAGPILPANMREAMEFSQFMSKGRLVPVHLQGNPSDCLAVTLQAIRWQCDPFAVAQCTSVIGGKLMYEGKLTMAIANTSGKLHGRLRFAFEGEGDAREVICAGRIIGDAEPAEVRVRFKDARTNNRMWTTQPDQQLCYHSARVWARRFMPELMLGIYSPEEFPEPTIDHQREQARANRALSSLSADQRTVDEARATPLIELTVRPGEGSISFPKTKHGIGQTLDFLEK